MGTAYCSGRAVLADYSGLREDSLPCGQDRSSIDVEKLDRIGPLIRQMLQLQSRQERSVKDIDPAFYVFFK